MEEEKDIQVRTISFAARVPVLMEVEAEKNKYGDVEVKRVFNVSAPAPSDIMESLDEAEFEELEELFNKAD